MYRIYIYRNFSASATEDVSVPGMARLSGGAVSISFGGGEGLFEYVYIY